MQQPHRQDAYAVANRDKNLGFFCNFLLVPKLFIVRVANKHNDVDTICSSIDLIVCHQVQHTCLEVIMACSMLAQHINATPYCQLFLVIGNNDKNGRTNVSIVYLEIKYCIPEKHQLKNAKCLHATHFSSHFMEILI